MITFPTLESSSSYDYDALGPPHTSNDSSRLHHQNTFQASPQQHDMSIVQNSMSSSFYSPNMFDYSFSQSLNSQVGFPLETNLQNYHPQPSVPQLMSGDYSPSQNELVYNLTSLESFPSSYLASGSNSIEFNPIIEARANLSNVAITQGPISQSPIGQTAPNFNINRGGIDTRVDNRSNATFEINPNTQLIPTNLNSFDYQEDNQFTTNIQYPNLLTKMKTLQPNLYESIELRKNMETIPENVNNLAYSHNNFAPKLDQIAILQSNNNQMENQVKNFERLRIQNQPQQVPNETPSCYSASSSVSSTHPIAIMDSSLEAKMLHLQPFPPQGPSIPSPALNYYDALNASTSRSISTGSEFTPTEVTHQKSNIPFGDSSLSINVANDIEIKPKKHTRRRLLPRSKKGCWICRIKHMKCDEVRPICSNCSKFGIECDYSSQKPPYVFDKKLRQAKLLSISLIRKQNQMALKKSEKASYVK